MVQIWNMVKSSTAMRLKSTSPLMYIFIGMGGEPTMMYLCNEDIFIAF